jgi:hypothetical protein
MDRHLAKGYSLATRDFLEESVPRQPISAGARRPGTCTVTTRRVEAAAGAPHENRISGTSCARDRRPAAQGGVVEGESRRLCPRRERRRDFVGDRVPWDNRSDDVVGLVEQVTTRIATAIGDM